MIATLKDLGLAWRKAKVDLYYSTYPQLLAMAEYEHDLAENLERLQQKLNDKDERWVKKADFLGDWTLAPKAIKPVPTEGPKENSGLIFAAPDDEWVDMTQGDGEPTAEFRLMSRCSMDFHVLSALWMMEVGDLFDKTLGSNVYGSRLRRNRFDQINTLALGSFKPYLKPFRDWRDGGIKAMRAALADSKKVLALTADVSSFYHELNPGFMLDERFLSLARIKMNRRQAKLHRLFIGALQAWSKKTPLRKGLPVGLPASAVVANSALLKLDQFIEQQVVPLYYGRYVDDILLVMENTSNVRTTEQFWSWVFNRDGGKDLLKSSKGSILFKPDYLKGSRIAFENSKNKLFVLSGNPGTALVNAISEQINQRASEWRSLPDLPDTPATVATDLLKATNNAGEQADNLRKTDALTLHRAGFALNLRDYEAYERDLPPQAWKAHRHAFFDAVIDHLLTPVKFFELAQYLPRIVRMATACEDFEQLGRLIRALDKLLLTVEKDCQIEIKAQKKPVSPEKCITQWQQTLAQTLYENIVSAFPSSLSQSGAVGWQAFIAQLEASLKCLGWALFDMLDDLNTLQGTKAFLFSHDLAHTPLRFAGLPREMISQRGILQLNSLKPLKPTRLLSKRVLRGMGILSDWLNLDHGTPAGLIFATRPFSLNELYLIARKPFAVEKHSQLGRVIWALRGFELTEHQMPYGDPDSKVLRIPDGGPKAKQTVAVASWETLDQSFIAAAMGKPDPDSRRRYQRLNRLINELISRPDGAGYLILPELALPPQWFMRIADKLKGRGISLITGVEYLHSGKHVHNQMWASLTHDGLGFPSLMLYRQDKQLPAFHEEHELFRLAGVKMKPAVKWKSPPLIQHGDFRFALLNCSELTNIRYRAKLRGKVDALFVPEWNSDTDTFNALVESAALDIHAYIIQCNNRQYGDSRIRAPYKDRWKRDLLRVKGGNHDYCITGEIDVLALRQFQSSHRSPPKDFKPVPDGFSQDMEPQRKVLPKGGQA
ncbi:reverse transcriptase [Pseudomonas sp. BN414]|uniref:RNA-directed DNA polymerase n=1 Tax=Pseudomonas sp. BN414 TaxID=2567888 RepID=UPI002454FC8E|nr:RNA-directed DNA polymerase [Pseudomonas sp. BN414]MDH4565324.1 reverse transcriptase [Pseudomonas sp. BN414]